MPSKHHWGVVKCLLCYLNGTRSLGIWLLVDTPQALHSFSNADWVGNPDDRTSTSVFLIFLGVNPISWSSTKKHTVARSSIKAKYRAIMVVVAKLQWVKSLMSELLIPVQSLPTLKQLISLGVTYVSVNPAFHSFMKQLAIDYHFVYDLVQSSELRIVHVSTGNQLVDALTKTLSRPSLFSLCNKIGVIFSTPS